MLNIKKHLELIQKHQKVDIQMMEMDIIHKNSAIKIGMSSKTSRELIIISLKLWSQLPLWHLLLQSINLFLQQSVDLSSLLQDFSTLKDIKDGDQKEE